MSKLPRTLNAYIDPNAPGVSTEQFGRRGGRRGVPKKNIISDPVRGSHAPLYPITDPELAGDLNPDVRDAMPAEDDGMELKFHFEIPQQEDTVIAAEEIGPDLSNIAEELAPEIAAAAVEETVDEDEEVEE
jgi:hypothetical protein